MGPPTKSAIWTYFKPDEHDREKAQCTICHKSYSRKGRTTTSLKNHLKSMHPDQYDSFIGEDDKKLQETKEKSEDQVKLRWRNLRDQFHRELKKNPVTETGSPKIDQYSGKWTYYDMLTFLKDYYKAVEESKDDEKDDASLNNDEDLIVIKQEADFDGEIQIEPETFLDPLEPYEDSSDSLSTPVVETQEVTRNKLQSNARRVKRLYVNRQIGIQNKRRQRASTFSKEVDEDLHFALSLVPYLRRLDPLRKLIVRNEMQNLLIGELISDSQTSKAT